MQYACIRVNSADQNIARQEEALLTAGFQPDKICGEHASAKDTNRPELQKLLEQLRPGDTLLVHSIDRLCRNMMGMCAVTTQLRNQGVTLIFLKGQLTFSAGMSNSMQKLRRILAFFSAVPETGGTCPSRGSCLWLVLMVVMFAIRTTKGVILKLLPVNLFLSGRQQTPAVLVLSRRKTAILNAGSWHTSLLRESSKRYLWHGNVAAAHIGTGEPVSTAFVESTINEVIARRMAKKQQMQWSRKGAHYLLQTRTAVLNNELQDKFACWYPRFAMDDQSGRKVSVIEA